MDTKVFFNEFFYGQEGGTHLHKLAPALFWVCSVGKGDELSRFSYSWVALDVISTLYLLPFGHPRVL